MELLPSEMKTIVAGAFAGGDLANIKFAGQILPGVKDIEGQVHERIKAVN